MFLKRLLDKASKKFPSSREQKLQPEELQPHLVFHNGVPTGPRSLAYDRVQRILAVSTRDGCVKLFGDHNAQAFLEFDKAVPGKFLQFVENQGLLLNVTNDNHIEVWDIITKQLAHVHAFSEEITSFSVLQQKMFIYIGDCLGNVSILKVDVEKRQLMQMQYHIPFSESYGAKEDPSAVMFLLPQPMAESRRLLIIFQDGTISLWGVQESKKMFFIGGNSSTLHTETREVTSACWGCPTGSKVVLGYKNGEIYVWNVPKLSEMKATNISNQKDSYVPFFKLNLIYKVNKIPIISLKWNYADGRAPRLYINGSSDHDSSFQVVVLNENTESRMVKLVLPLSETCLDIEIISSYNEQTKKREDALVVLLKSGQLCVCKDFDIESYLLHSQSKSAPQFPKQLMVNIPFISSAITVAKVVSERFSNSASPNESLVDLASRIPSLFSTGSRDGNTQLSTRFGFTDAFKLYITGHQDGSVSFWDVSCCLLLPILSIKPQGEELKLNSVTALQFDASSRILITGYSNGLVRLYTFKSPESATNSIFSLLQAKQGCNYAVTSIKLDGAIMAICLNPKVDSFAVGTEKGYVYAIKIEGMAILHQKQFSSELSPSISNLLYHNYIVDGSVKTILLVGMEDSSISCMEGDTGQMLSVNTIQRKKPTRSLFMQILDIKYTSGHQPLILHCSEKSACLYSLSHAMQGLKKVFNKKKLHGHCCWATTFCSPSCSGLVLVFANCKMEIRSLPELNLLKETQVRGLTLPNKKTDSVLDAAICSSSDGSLIVAKGCQEIFFYSMLKSPNRRNLGFIDQVYKMDVSDPQKPSYPAHNQKETKMGVFITVMKDVKGIKAKDEREDIHYCVTAAELSNLFSICNFPLASKSARNLGNANTDFELDIDDIDIEDTEEKSTGQNVTAFNKQLGNKFNAIKDKLKVKVSKKPEVAGKEGNKDEKAGGSIDEIKRRYGYSVTGEASIPKLAQNKLQQNINKLQQ